MVYTLKFLISIRRLYTRKMIPVYIPPPNNEGVASYPTQLLFFYLEWSYFKKVKFCIFFLIIFKQIIQSHCSKPKSCKSIWQNVSTLFIPVFHSFKQCPSQGQLECYSELVCPFRDVFAYTNERISFPPFLYSIGSYYICFSILFTPR